MIDMQDFLKIDWWLFSYWLLPLLIVAGGALSFFTIAAFTKKNHSTLFSILCGLVLLSALSYTWNSWLEVIQTSLALFQFDSLSYSFDLLFLIIAILIVILSKTYLQNENIRAGEYYGLILTSTLGGMIIAHAADFSVLFLGVEVMSLSAYILAGFKKGKIRSYEASLKYFILGSFASAFLLFGIALGYGLTGSTLFSEFQKLTTSNTNYILLNLSMACLLIGLLFKVAAAPFHLWTPDVYEGSPTPVTAFMASVIKAAAFAAFIRVVLIFGHLEIPWVPVLTGVAMLTMFAGNLVALKQTNLKRMLAYSSIAHAGYALVGIITALQNPSLTAEALGGVIFYLFAYSFMTVGAFGIVMALGRRGDQVEEMSDLIGLAKEHPLLSVAFSVFLFSLTGFPPSIGFMGKLFIFGTAMKAGLTGLVVIGVINSAISAYYYLGPIVKMFFQRDKEIEFKLPPLSYSLVTALFICLFVVLYLGLFPSDIYVMARESVSQLLY